MCVCLFIYLSAYLSVRIHVRLSICPAIFLYIRPFITSSIHPSILPSIHLSITDCSFIPPLIHPSICHSVLVRLNHLGNPRQLKGEPKCGRFSAGGRARVLAYVRTEPVYGSLSSTSAQHRTRYAINCRRTAFFGQYLICTKKTGRFTIVLLRYVDKRRISEI